MRQKATRRKRKGGDAFVSTAQTVIEAMLRAGVQFQWLPCGGLVVRGLSRCSPELRAAFLDGDGAQLHQAARALAVSGVIPL